MDRNLKTLFSFRRALNVFWNKLHYYSVLIQKKKTITVDKTQFDTINLFSASSPLYLSIAKRTYILRL